MLQLHQMLFPSFWIWCKIVKITWFTLVTWHYVMVWCKYDKKNSQFDLWLLNYCLNCRKIWWEAVKGCQNWFDVTTVVVLGGNCVLRVVWDVTDEFRILWDAGCFGRFWIIILGCCNSFSFSRWYKWIILKKNFETDLVTNKTLQRTKRPTYLKQKWFHPPKWFLPKILIPS